MLMLKKIIDVINALDLKNKPLCERPSDDSIRSDRYTNARTLDELEQTIFSGARMHDSQHSGGEDTWRFPDGVEEKIKDDRKYKIWYRWSDASDPCDTSTFYRVYYIEEVNPLRLELINYLTRLLADLR